MATAILHSKHLCFPPLPHETAPRLPFDMISPKTNTLVLNVVVGEEERLYVLSDNMYPDIRPPFFESYTLSTNSWEQLDPPPFLNPKSKYFDTSHHYPTLVLLFVRPFVSPRLKPHSNLTLRRRFESLVCCLKVFKPWWWTTTTVTVMGIYITNADYTPCGPPFGFMGKAVLFEDDVLNCMLPFAEGNVVAYKIEGGKVMDSQSLMAQGLVIPPEAVCPCIADFGNGLFCLVLTLDNIFEPPSILNVMMFFIKKKTVMKPGDFLHCEIINEFKYVEKDVEGWYPSCCFAQ